MNFVQLQMGGALFIIIVFSIFDALTLSRFFIISYLWYILLTATIGQRLPPLVRRRLVYIMITLSPLLVLSLIYLSLPPILRPF